MVGLGVGVGLRDRGVAGLGNRDGAGLGVGVGLRDRGVAGLGNRDGAGLGVGGRGGGLGA